MDNKFSRVFLYIATALYPVLFFISELFYVPLSFNSKICILFFVLTSCLCACEDLLTRTLPDFFNIIIFISGLTFCFCQSGFRIMASAFIKSIVLMIVLYAVFLIAKGGIGGGDIKMIVSASAFIDPIDALICVWQATMLAAPFAIILLLQSKYHKKKEKNKYDSSNTHETNLMKKTKQPLTLPFGPFYTICLLLELYTMF